jgi:hypothetical protein
VYQAGDGASVYDIQIDAAQASRGNADTDGAIIFPDADLLFTAEFRRSGSDLVLIGHDATAVVIGYFKDERRPSIRTPEGASLNGATIEALAGPDAPGDYAQTTKAALTTQVQASIGRVEKVSGTATVLRNGVPVELHLGDPVAKGDVVQTGSDSSLTIKFADGTVFGLSSSARMVLNDMVYAADSHSNSALFTLVQGVIGFVAGRVAKTGDLKVDTPVATMAIRGTAVHTEIAALSGITKISLLTEPDGTVGSFILLDKNDPSRVLTSISDPRVATLITPRAASDLSIAQVAKTADDIRDEGDLARELFQVFAFDPRQKRGSGDVKDGSIVPADLHREDVSPDHALFTVTPYIPEVAMVRTTSLPPLVSPPAPIRGTAVEDGPLQRLDAPTVSGPNGAVSSWFVDVPAPLPPGVRYVESSQTFTLDPSHPAYQHLGESEKQTVTVNYSLVSAGTRMPASVSWTVSGENDAPTAGSDQIVGLNEIARSIIAVRANDRDIDGDSLHILEWTAPAEGSVSRSAAGDLVFNPGSDFQALSAGETATVSFVYTIADGKGGAGSANVILQVRGSGVFSSPLQSAATSKMIDFNHQPVSLAIEAPTATTAATADLSIDIGLGPVPQPQRNIIYVIDVSGSTSAPFKGAPVGDPNGDGVANTILDAEIDSLVQLTDRIRATGFSPDDVSVTVIPFNGSADPADPASSSEADGSASATFSLGVAGDAAISNFLRDLDPSGQTDFADALRAANARLKVLDQGGEKNFLYFLSDGEGQGAVTDQLTTLDNVYGAKITAVGVGSDAKLNQLDAIDYRGQADLLTAPGQLDASVVGLPLAAGQVVDVAIFVNGKEVPEIGPEDLVSTAEGFALDASVGGLGRITGDINDVSATVTFASGEVLTAGLTITGALPRSTDFLL